MSSTPKKATPKGWPRISSAIFYEDARAAIDFLRDAFGFEVQLLVEGENGRVEHSELVYGDGLVMVASTGVTEQKPDAGWRRSPRAIDGGGNTQSMMVFVDSADEHCEQARAKGAVIATEPTTTDYGDDYWSDRNYEAIDPEGHHWWFTERVRSPGE